MPVFERRAGANQRGLVVNARGYSLLVTLRAIHATLPGAGGFSLSGSEAWAILLIAASSDEAVGWLAHELGLGPIEVRTTAGRWRYGARSERERGALRIEVAGPHHIGSPPGDDTASGSP